MEGNLVGSEEHNIKGETTFRWLAGGCFLEQRARIDLASHAWQRALAQSALYLVVAALFLGLAWWRTLRPD